MNGPDQVLPTTNITSTTLLNPVAIRSIEEKTLPPRSVPSYFNFICNKYPNKIAMCHKVKKSWTKITYKKYLQLVRTCAKAFISLGLTPNSVVCIIGFNSPEWFISDLAAIYAGGVAAGIYTTNSADACLYCLSHSKAKIVVVEDNVQLTKILSIRKSAPDLKAIIQYTDPVKSPEVMSWGDVMILGESVNDSVLEKALTTIAINKCCTLVYTSGTTGNPKGAMLSHDNVIYDAVKIGEKLKLTVSPQEVYVSYLPLSHVAGNIVDIHCCYIHCCKVYFADKDALRGSLIKTFQQVHPTRILSVPRVWEKIFERFQEIADKSRGLKKLLSAWAKKHGLRKNLAREQNAKYGGCYSCAKIIAFSKVKKKLGISKCKSIISGAAPLALDVKHYFASLDVIICEAFGMSECSALHCCNVPDNFRLSSCGTSCPGMVTIIDKPDKDGQGELCINGRHVFMGYLNDASKTAEAIDKNGNLHSGDVGKMDNDGFIYITGRIKEILITAGGENVAPVLIEQQIKAALPCVGFPVVIGDRKKFLIVLLTFTAEINDKQEPTDNLAPVVKNWLGKLGLSFTTMTEVMKSGPDPKILAGIQQGLDVANQSAISNAQKIQKFAILPHDFSQATGELGPTMKVKRNAVDEKYKNIIDKVYSEAAG